jgi:Mce-associated membrane protein
VNPVLDTNELAIDDHAHQRASDVRVALAATIIIVLMLGSFTGWLGSQAYKSHRDQHQSAVFLEVGRQAAIDLTTISHTDVDSEVQRILDSSTGRFRDDFEKRAPAFIQVVKQAQSTAQGTVTAAGLESEMADHAEVLVAVSVTNSSSGAQDQPARAWRMRINVEKVGNGAKVADVAFVP